MAQLIKVGRLPPHRLDRKLAAILAADVAGYSRLMGADEEGTLSQLRSHRAALIEPKIAECRGRAGQRIRISGQLVDATSGTHLWADRFEGTLEDVFDLQDSVTTSVVGSVFPTIRHAEMERAKHRPTESTDAHLTYMRGLGCLYWWTKPSLEEALKLFYDAMAIDPAYSLPYGGRHLLCHPTRDGLGLRFRAARSESLDPHCPGRRGRP